jgi:hypothetical protein
MKATKSHSSRLAWHALIAVLLLLAVPLSGMAAAASDHAGNYSTWTGDQGSGMGAWSFTAPSNSGYFLSNNSHTACDIATQDSGSVNRCWGLWAQSGALVEATRSFDSDMGVNSEVFTIFMDNGGVDSGSVGFNLQNADKQDVLSFYYAHGGTNAYKVAHFGGVTDSTVAWRNTGLKIEVFLPTASTFRLNIRQPSDNALLQQISGTLLNPVDGRTIRGFRLFNFNAGGGNDLFFNSVSITSGTLAVTLADFHAAQQGDAVLVTWETASELDNRGFNLYRGTSPDGWDRQLNTTLIPSQSQGSPGGFVYTWLDDVDLVPGTSYYYWLQDVDTSGAMTMHGPVSVDYIGPTAVTLNGVQASPAAGAAALPWLWIVAGAGAALRAGRLKRRG